MDKDELVVGAICKYEREDIPTTVVTVISTDSELGDNHVTVRFEMGDGYGRTFQPDTKYLTEQIGYDARLSPEYQSLADSYNDANEAIESVETLIAFIDKYQCGGQKQILLNWMQNHESLRDAANHAMDKITVEKSWMKEDNDA